MSQACRRRNFAGAHRAQRHQIVGRESAVGRSRSRQRASSDMRAFLHGQPTIRPSALALLRSRQVRKTRDLSWSSRDGGVCRECNVPVTERKEYFAP